LLGCLLCLHGLAECGVRVIARARGACESSSRRRQRRRLRRGLSRGDHRWRSLLGFRSYPTLVVLPCDHQSVLRGFRSKTSKSLRFAPPISPSGSDSSSKNLFVGTQVRLQAGSLNCAALFCNASRGVAQNVAHAAIMRPRRSNMSPRRYACSTLLLTCAPAPSPQPRWGSSRLGSPIAETMHGEVGATAPP
jgi:hypothetical protein